MIAPSRRCESVNVGALLSAFQNASWSSGVNAITCARSAPTSYSVFGPISGRIALILFARFDRFGFAIDVPSFIEELYRKWAKP
jgi:hypothetical protein